MMVHIYTGHVFSSFAVSPTVPKIRNSGPKFWPFNGEYLENSKLQHYMSIRA